MKHNRPDYAAIQPWPTKRPHIVKVNGETRELELTDDPSDDDLQPIIPDDEPVFLLRAKDPWAAETVRFWAWLQSRNGADVELVMSCERFADEMEAYYDDYYASRKSHADVPDTKELRA